MLERYVPASETAAEKGEGLDENRVRTSSSPLSFPSVIPTSPRLSLAAGRLCPPPPPRVGQSGEIGSDRQRTEEEPEYGWKTNGSQLPPTGYLRDSGIRAVTSRCRYPRVVVGAGAVSLAPLPLVRWDCWAFHLRHCGNRAG